MRDTASTAMDNRISLFVKEFENLKSNFALGIGVQTWRSIHNIENEIHRFGSTLEEINASGQIIFRCFFFLLPNRLEIS
jgi:hypothetical protein